MSILGSWVVTLAFFFVVFLVGKYLQYREKQERITSRANDAIRRQFTEEVIRRTAEGRAPILGTLYGDTTAYEKLRTGPR
jgi:hypothetical protein